MTEHDEMTGEIEPHDTHIVVWDAPSTIECGEKFSVKLGVKCSSECRPDGWTFEVPRPRRERAGVGHSRRRAMARHRRALLCGGGAERP